MQSVTEKLFAYAIDLAIAGRIFTLQQLARHPDLSWRSQPVKRASDFLRPHHEAFTVRPGPHGKPFRWSLTDAMKRRRGLRYRDVHPDSIHSEHWLMIGDLWQAMTHAAGRPRVYLAEPKHSAGFDVFTIWAGRALLIEIQRTPIRAREWQKKWAARMDWYKRGEYKEAPWQTSDIVPRPVVIVTHNQTEETIQAPTGALVCQGIEDFVRKIKSPR